MLESELQGLIAAAEGAKVGSFEFMPVHGSPREELDQRRLDEYFLKILGEEAVDNWPAKLELRELLVRTNGDGTTCCSYGGHALFALAPRRRLPQAGLRLLIFPGADATYDALLDEVLDIPFVGLGDQRPGRFIEQSLPDRALAYLQPHISRETA